MQDIAAASPRTFAASFHAGRTWARSLEVPTVDGPQVNWSLAFEANAGQSSFGGPSIWTTADVGATWVERRVP